MAELLQLLEDLCLLHRKGVHQGNDLAFFFFYTIQHLRDEAALLTEILEQMTSTVGVILLLKRPQLSYKAMQLRLEGADGSCCLALARAGLPVRGVPGLTSCSELVLRVEGG